MSVIIRGVKNTFRNSLRTIGFSVIIAVSLSLAFSMLLANQAVHDRGQQLRTDIGASLLVYPAGSSGGLNAQLFTDADVDKLGKLPNVREVIKTAVAVAQHPDDTKKNKEITQKNKEVNGKDGLSSAGGDGLGSDLETSLLSSIQSEKLKNFSTQTPIMPVTIEGLAGPIDQHGRKLNPIEGRVLTTQDTESAMIGKTLAEKNNLKIGSTFTVKDKTFTIVGIFDAGTVFGNNRVIVPFEAVRKLQELKDGVPSLLVLGNSLDTLDTVKEDIQKALEGGADVIILQQESLQLATSLKSIETISFVTLIVALAAGALTILLTMLLVVRERVKEIGILKALGATNTKIVGQFLAEATVLTAIGTFIGMIFAAVAGNLVLQALLSKAIPNDPAAPGDGALAATPTTLDSLATQVTTLVDWHFLAYGLGIVLLLTILGTVIPAFLIAKVRPAQIMRGDS